MSINIIQLPPHILANILKNLKLSDIRNVILTCRTLKNLIIHDNSIWRAICERRLILHNRSERVANYSWYNKCRISRNWCNGIYKKKIISRTALNYMPWLKYYNSDILILSLGSDLSCYTSDNRGLPYNKPCWTLNVPTVRRNDVRTNDISRFAVTNNLIACGNRDGSLSIYHVNKLTRMPNLIQHLKNCHERGQVEVSAVEIIQDDYESCIASSSGKSPSVVLWKGNNNYNFQNKMDVYIPDGKAVKSLAVNNGKDKLAIGLDGNSRPVWIDVRTGTILTTAESTINITQMVRDIQWHNENNLIYVTHSGMLVQIDTRINSIVYNARDPLLSKLYCVKTDRNNAILIGSSEYSRCVLFDARNQSNHVQMYFTQRRSSPVYCLDFDATKLITAIDCGVSLLNFNIDGKTTEQRDFSHVFHCI